MQFWGFFAAISAAVMWGLMYSVDQKILSTLSPLTLLFVTSAIATILSLPLAVLDRYDLRVLFTGDRNTLYLVILSQTLGLIASFFIFTAIKYLGAPKAVIFEIAYPLFVAIFTLLLFGGRLNTAFWIGAGCMLIGSAVIVKWG